MLIEPADPPHGREQRLALVAGGTHAGHDQLGRAPGLVEAGEPASRRERQREPNVDDHEQ